MFFVRPTSSPDVTKYYEEQREEAKVASALYRESRLPKYARHLAATIRTYQGQGGGGGFIFGGAISEADTAVFQTIRGVQHGFPNAWAGLPAGDAAVIEGVVAAVEGHERVAAYLASERRMGYNEHGLFRRYPELDPK